MRPAIAVFFCVLAAATLAWPARGHASMVDSQPSAAQQFDTLYGQIRDGRIARDAALTKVRALLPLIAADFHAHGGKEAPPTAWRFPLDGYGVESIGGRNGSGYVAAGYDWFDGYKSHGHPGHDLFIHDRNQDELDDDTGAPVKVLSISSGIVVASAPDWQTGSVLRGGRYLYIYDPALHDIFYYAHQRSLLVTPGDIVAPGEAIGTVGRSGRNAAAPRSPTHLHVMLLTIDDGGYPRPHDLYPDLVRLGRRTSRF